MLSRLPRALGRDQAMGASVAVQALPSQEDPSPGGASCTRGWSCFSPSLVAFQSHLGEGSSVRSVQSSRMQPVPDPLPPASRQQVAHLLQSLSEDSLAKQQSLP